MKGIPEPFSYQSGGGVSAHGRGPNLTEVRQCYVTVPAHAMLYLAGAIKFVHRPCDFCQVDLAKQKRMRENRVRSRGPV